MSCFNIFLFPQHSLDSPIIFPRREHLHRARLELGDQRLRVERVVRQQVRGGSAVAPCQGMKATPTDVLGHGGV
jgi:hypothetical protein